MKRVYKYGTGENIPEGAVYLTTLVEETDLIQPYVINGEIFPARKNRFVWHYFLVEVKE